MRAFPIDVAAVREMMVAVVSIDPVVDFKTGEQKKDKDGVPKWRLEILVREPGAMKSEVEHINFSALQVPDLDPTAELVITGLVGRPWSNENDFGFSSGVSMSAAHVGFKPKSSTAGNGSRSEDKVAA